MALVHAATSMPARVTLAEASAVSRELVSRASTLQADNPDVPLVLDATGLEAFDSSAFAVMLEVARKAAMARRRVKVRGAPAAMIDLAGLYGVDELLDFSAA